MNPQMTFEILTRIGAVIASLTLLIIHGVQLATSDLPLWYVLVLPLSWVLADLLSGIVHWTADTWGSEDTPIIGPRFIRPFRLHHVDAEDIVSRPFFRLNGDVALGVLPILGAAFFAPGVWRFFLVTLALCILPTNQIHQWAHQPVAPPFARALQRLGLFLRPDEHRLHHTHPNHSHFCITTGWCNGLLQRIVTPLEERIRRS
jgi:plasmanylethanolamine desaturase